MALKKRTPIAITPQALKHCKYLSFKARLCAEKEKHPLLIDRERTQGFLQELYVMKSEKEQALKEAMPDVVTLVNPPVVMYKKDGTLSVNGRKWLERLVNSGYPETHKGPIEVRDEPNPDSTPQVKDWLFSLGWEPDEWKPSVTKVDSKGKPEMVPQVRYPDGERKGELTDSILVLAEREEAVKALDGYTKINHRIGVLKGFLSGSDENGVAVSSCSGLTNTLRFKHEKPIVNLPKADGEVFFGEQIRSCIIVPEGKICCGSDVVSLEDTTKQHYMYTYDPEYVEEMQQEGFDPHLNLAVFAGAITREDYENYPLTKDPAVKKIRGPYKTVNYSATYKVGAKKLAKSLGITVKEAQAILDAFWERNKAIKQLEEDTKVFTMPSGSMWLYNPVSGLIYSLRYKKDIFSTLNQSTGVFIFDTWLAYCLKEGLELSLDYHDELLTYVEPDKKEETERLLKEAMRKVNERLNLNVEIKVDVQFGANYKEVH